MGDKNLRVPGTPGTTIRFASYKKGRQEEIGGKNLRVPGTPGTTICSQATQATRRETRGNYIGNENVRVPGTPLQEGRQEQIIM